MKFRLYTQKTTTPGGTRGAKNKTDVVMSDTIGRPKIVAANFRNRVSMQPMRNHLME
jgi:hypothetical protein